jgi:hypothetical protein
MRSSPTITLFAESRDIGQSPTSLAASVLFHCLAIGLLSFGVMYTPHLDTKAIASRYTVRNIELETPEQQRQREARKNIKYPTPPSKVKPAKSGIGKTAVRMPLLRQVAKAPRGPQTLVQPDLPEQVELTQEVPVPTMVIWSPKKADVKTVVAPQPEKPTAADVKPVPDPPNRELNLADISIAAKPTAAAKLPTPAGTTSPIEIQAPDRVQLAPATVTQTATQPTPAAIMSLSDIKMAEGKVVLPPVNESAATDTQGELMAGAAQAPSAEGDGNLAGRPGAGQGSTAATDAAKLPANATPPAHEASEEANQNGPPVTTQITLPKDGQFGSVVVGASLQDQYPELSSVWSGRLAYTVFLHVGLARSWVLQYSLPRTSEAEAAGAIARLEAPWPYSIVRPNFPAGTADGNTIMVHGFVNLSGRFEGLSVLFPPQFQQSEFVLRSLQNWQFRPANQNQQPVRVEVLLIIPGEF